MNTSKSLSVRFFQILGVLAIFAMAFARVTPVSAQSGATYITSNDQLPQQGQLVIPANVGWRAPASLHGLVVTLWYGGKDDNTSTMLHLSDGLASDRTLKYGGTFPTVVWDGERAPISSGQNCRPDFYSDSVVLTDGVVYGDKCPIVIEYHIDHFVSMSAASAPSSTVYDDAYARSVCGNRQVDSLDPVTGHVECQKAATPIDGSTFPWILVGFLVILIAIYGLFFQPATEAPASRRSGKTAKPVVKKTIKK